MENYHGFAPALADLGNSVCFVCCLCQCQHFYVQKNLYVNSKLGITVLQRIKSLTYSSFLKF